MDAAERLLLRDGKVVLLQPKVFDLLLVLVEYHGHLLEKDELMRLVWPDTVVEEANLANNISILRKTLSDNGERFIETVPKCGYRFVASVRSQPGNGAELVVEKHSTAQIDTVEEESGVPGEYVEAHESANEKALAAAGRVNLKPRWRLSRVMLAACLLLAGFAAALAYFWVSSRPKVVRSIAVLPFKSLETDAGGQYLGLGMANTLITRLGNVRQFTLRPTSAVDRYSTIERDAVAIGREQRVDAVLDGIIRRIGERIRVTVQLLSVPEGRVLWSEKFDEQFTDIFSIEDLVTERVAAALTIKFTGEKIERSTKRHPQNVEAYEAYLKGRFSSIGGSAEGWRKSLVWFRRAIKLDPDYALAYAGLAVTYVRLGTRGLLPPEEGWLKMADFAALKALGIDDKLPEAYASLASVRFHEWQLAAADMAFKKAVALNPVEVQPYNLYINFLQITGKLDEADKYIRRAQEIDPVSVSVKSHLARGFLRAGRYHEAIDQYKKVIAIDSKHVPAHNNLAGAYAAKGMYEEAIAEINLSIKLDNSPQRRGQHAALGRVYALSGKMDEARKVLADLKEHSKTVYIPAYNFAIIYEALGDRKQAFAWLDKAYGERDIALLELRRDGFNSIRSDPKFTDLLQRIDASCR